MKRISILVAIVCALSIAATASAAKSKYTGEIKPSGELSFTLKSKNGQANVLKLRWEQLPVRCGGTPQTSSGMLNFAVRVVDKSFKARAVLGNPNKPKAEAKVAGDIKRKNASGRITLSGTNLPLDDGGSADCSSGKLRWDASR